VCTIHRIHEILVPQIVYAPWFSENTCGRIITHFCVPRVCPKVSRYPDRPLVKSGGKIEVPEQGGDRERQAVVCWYKFCGVIRSVCPPEVGFWMAINEQPSKSGVFVAINEQPSKSGVFADLSVREAERKCRFSRRKRARGKCRFSRRKRARRTCRFSRPKRARRKCRFSRPKAGEEEMQIQQAKAGEEEMQI